MITIKTLTKKEMDKKRKITKTTGGKMNKKRKITKTDEDKNISENIREYKQIIKKTLIPLHKEYTDKYGFNLVSKDFIKKKCEDYCDYLINDRMKLLHAETCAQFLRLMIGIRQEIELYDKLMCRFHINNYSVDNFDNVKEKMQYINNLWIQNANIRYYNMVYKVQRLKSLFDCIFEHNVNMQDKFDELNNKKNMIKESTTTFIEKESENIFINKIYNDWQNITTEEFEQLSSLKTITLQDWNNIEDCINNFYK